MRLVDRSLAPVALLCLAGIVMVPLVVFPNPALLDYQNHLARLWIIADPAHRAELARYYQVDWRGMSQGSLTDLAAWGLGPFFDALAIGRLILGASILLPPLGALALNVRLFGRPGAGALIFPFFAWTLTALGGFMSFQMGVGLALLAVGLEPVFGRKMLTRLVGRVLCGVVVYLAHGLDLAFYALLLAALSFQPAPAPGRGAKAWLGGALRAASVAAVPLASVALVIAATGALPGNQEHAVPSPGYLWHSPPGAIASIFSPLRAYDMRVDAALALAAAATLALAAVRGRARVHPALMWTAALFALASPFMPYVTPSGDWTDRRLPLLALFTALAAFRIEPRGWRDAAALAVASVLLVCFRTAYIAHAWTGAERLADATDQALMAAPRGAVVLAMQHEPADREFALQPNGRFLGRATPNYWFLGSSVVWLRGGFTPMLFTQRGVHPLHVAPAFRDIAYAEGGYLPSVNALSNPKVMARYPPYVRAWRTRFDYVLVMNADFPDRNGEVRLPPELTPVRDTGFAQLYRVTRPATVAALPPPH